MNPDAAPLRPTRLSLMMQWHGWLLLLLVALAPPLAAQRVQAISPQLLVEGPVAAGGSVDVALLMRVQPGWHGYWLNPGDAGQPLSTEWRNPPGVALSDWRYPAPDRLLMADLMNHVFKGDHALIARLKLPATARGVVPLRAQLRWLACTDKICVPESGEVQLDVAVGAKVPRDARFDGWRAALPQTLSTPGRMAIEGGRLRVAIPYPASAAADDVHLFVAEDRIIDYAAPQTVSRRGDWLVVETKARDEAAAAGLSGVVRLGCDRALAIRAEPGPVPRGASLGGNGLWLALIGALAGGLLLNLMPCVFPVLTLKALHLARAGGDNAREARGEALAYLAGTVAGTTALGAILLLIRAAGVAAGWAFQLQDPRTILLLFLLASAMALNLAGLFQLPAFGGRARPAGSFMTGALAAFVATPCAGPFLGTALGAALVLPPLAGLAIFALMGVGLGLPFVLLGFIPALRRRLPRPGAWMERLRQILAVPMALTAVACLWLLLRQSGMAGVAVALAAASGMTVLLLWIGQRQNRGQGAGWLPLGGLALVALGGALLLPQIMPATDRQGPAFAHQRWSEATVAALRAEGKPLFVYFTADWCISCKVNESAAIGRDEVQAAFVRGGVVTLVGDWTRGDPDISRYLESRGRGGIPYYLWIGRDGTVEELPQILTPSMLIARANPAQPLPLAGGGDQRR